MATLKTWHYDKQDRENPVHLLYSDGTELLVLKADFDRAFGTIIQLTKDVCQRDYALKTA